MNKDSLFTPEEGVIPPGDTAPPYQDLVGYVWKRVWSWFHGTAEGGIYETLVDVSHYARGWWTWHVVSDPYQVSGGLPGWANHVYDYFENWPTHAWEWFDNKVRRLEWTFRSAYAGGRWEHLNDTYGRFKRAFANFRHNPATFIYARLPQWVKDLKAFWEDANSYIAGKIGWYKATWVDFWDNPFHWIVRRLGGNVIFWDYFIKEPGWYIRLLINTWIDNHIPWYRDLIGYIVDKIGWLRSKWDWFWRDPFAFVIAQAGGNTWWWKLFVADPLSYINLYIYGYLRAEYPALFTIYVWLTTKWDAFTREVGKFLANPYLYITALLQAWIEGWRDYIFGVVGDLFQGFQSSITDGLVRLTINLFPLGPVDRLPPYEYADLDSFIESMRWWLEGDGAKQEHGYDEIVKWAEENILKEKGLPRGP